MAFGAGALLFALTIELFGHVPHHKESHGYGAAAAVILGAVAGGLLFDLLNQLLNNRGAFIRRLGNARKFVLNIKIQRLHGLIGHLHASPLFRDIPPKSLAKLGKRLYREEFAAGTTVFRQGDAGNAMYFLISGEAEVIRHREGDRDKELADLKAGDVFGEMALLNDAPRNAEVRARSALRVYKILRQDFEEIIRKDARILMMWGSITLITGVGAFLGATLIPQNPEGIMFYAVLGIEGLAAGAMLTVIAETMLPEAFEHGGAIVGFSTLLGFLSALMVKIA